MTAAYTVEEGQSILPAYKLLFDRLEYANKHPEVLVEPKRNFRKSTRNEKKAILEATLPLARRIVTLTKPVVPTSRVVPITYPLERRVASPLTWFLVKVGGINWPDLQSKIEEGKYQITASARKIMNMPTIEPTLAESKEIELFSFLVKDITPKEEWVSPAKFYAKAEYLGYGPCPMEVGPYLRLAIQKQRPGEEIYIGMKPVAVPDAPNHPMIFCVRQDGVIYHDRNIGRWLSAVHADADHKGGFAPNNNVVLTKL
jgi:hypothetical protein